MIGPQNQYGADAAPGAGCACFFPLALAVEAPEGGLAVDFRNPEWLGFGQVTLRGASANFGLRFCPSCGGRAPTYSAADRDAYEVYRAERSAYDDVLAAQVMDDVRARALAHGAVGFTSDGYSASWRDPARHLGGSAQWDEDHRRVYTRLTFLR